MPTDQAFIHVVLEHGTRCRAFGDVSKQEDIPELHV